MDRLNAFIAHAITAIIAVTASMFLSTMIPDKTTPAPRIVMVDGQDSVLAFVKSMDGDLSDDDMQAAITGFATDMDATLARMAAEHGLIILDAKAVLAGGQNITEMALRGVLNQ